MFGDRFVLDRSRSAIFRWDVDNTWTVYAGSPGKAPGYADGAGASALMNYPEDHVADSYGNLFVADTGNHCIRKISQGVVSTLAGSNTAGYKDDFGTLARFTLPRALTLDAAGNIYVAEQWRVRKVRTLQTALLHQAL
jgi:hypothetical protein